MPWAEWTGLSAEDSLQAATANVVTTMPDVEPGDAEPLEVDGGVDGTQRHLEYTQPLTEGIIASLDVGGSAPVPAAAATDQDTTSTATSSSGAIPTRTWSPGQAITAACRSSSKVVAPSAC